MAMRASANAMQCGNQRSEKKVQSVQSKIDCCFVETRKLRRTDLKEKVWLRKLLKSRLRDNQANS